MTRPGAITSHVIQQLIDVAIVVADLTDHNPNVFYELAIRHAVNKPALLLIRDGDPIPFDLSTMRVVKYVLSSDGSLTAGSAKLATEQLTESMAEALRPDFKPESPVQLAIDLEKLHSRDGTNETSILERLLERVSSLGAELNNIKGTLATIPTESNNDGVTPERLSEVFEKYAGEVDVVRSARDAGLVQIFRWRKQAAIAFAPMVEAESEELAIVGSSLKGLFLKPDYVSLANAIRHRVQAGVPLKILLTHPRVADLRANQESRHPGDIGKEIVETLRTLRSWEVSPKSIRFYLATPTCFGVMTSTHMLINPYPYMSVSYDSPCYIFKAPEGEESEGYVYSAFDAHHFRAWNTELALPINDYDDAIREFEASLEGYADAVKRLLGKHSDSQSFGGEGTKSYPPPAS